MNPVSFKDFLRLVSCLFPGFNELPSRMECFNSESCICIYTCWLKGRLVTLTLKSLLATNGNIFVNDFRKTKRLMKGMTFSVLGCWLIVVGHTFRPG